MAVNDNTFTAHNAIFYNEGKPVFLNSGEIHYFRLKHDVWDVHLAGAKKAGLMAVSSYVPWQWHEPREGVFDFDGDTLPERNLNGWLQKCKKHGLKAIVKPGPYILAEFRGAGLPDWFLEQHAEKVRMRNRKGEIVASEGVNLFHPIYLEKVTRWYDRIMPLISSHEQKNNGAVIMMQICNEIGLFSWLAHQADYGGDVKERFIKYLQKIYSTIEEVNHNWLTDYKNFSQVELPPDVDKPFMSKGDRARDYDWHNFWRAYYAEYLSMLAQMARQRGVTVPFYHNLPGWIYGHGYEFPVNITMYDQLYGRKSDIIFGVDHIPEFLSHRNMHDDRIINDITAAMQGNKPLFAAEFQSGSREYHVVTNPREMELFYKASLANGLKGWNYYMFSQGRNPERKGFSGDTFYWFNPLTAEGERTSAFALVSKMSRIISISEKIITKAQRRAEVCILFYPHYYASELERPEKGASELQFVAAAIRRPAYFDGLLRVLQVLNIDYDMADLTRSSAQQLKNYKQVWAFSTDEMNAADQQTLVDYISEGGKLMIFPYIPDRDMLQQPCTLLRDALGISPAGTEVIDSPLVDVMGRRDIKCANPQVIYDGSSLQNAEPIAYTLTGSICGFVKPYGRGEVMHLGTWLGYDTEAHKPVYMALLSRLGGKLQQAASSNNNISVRQRFTAQNQALLFAGNYFNEQQFAALSYTHPAKGERVNFPLSGKEMLYPPLYAIVTPVCLQLQKELLLLHTTSDILDVTADYGSVHFSLCGDRDLTGELVLEGNGCEDVRSVTIDGKEAHPVKLNNRLQISYQHPHNKEITLTINTI
ncbi:MAG: beta-galactosidase [Bacteroidota bacterium]